MEDSPPWSSWLSDAISKLGESNDRDVLNLFMQISTKVGRFSFFAAVESLGFIVVWESQCQLFGEPVVKRHSDANCGLFLIHVEKKFVEKSRMQNLHMWNYDTNLGSSGQSDDTFFCGIFEAWFLFHVILVCSFLIGQNLSPSDFSRDVRRLRCSGTRDA